MARPLPPRGVRAFCMPCPPGTVGSTTVRKSLRNLLLTISSALLAGSLVACQANPGPAPVEEAPTTTEESTKAEATTTDAQAPDEDVPTGRSRINIGIDTLRNGFNPHLLADDAPVVRDIAELVLPSAFVGNRLNRDLLVDAATVTAATPTTAQTIRYIIAQEAQWSDGTPITGSDFEYLRRSIVETPGALNRAGYQAISAIRTSGGGKTVEVDFGVPVADWQQLFTHLLPSHLIQDSPEGFQNALYNTIPASAGRYMVRSIDRQRGMVTLSRNDRFWGARPATIELLTFHDARSTSRAGEFLRTGQSSFMNLTPTETLVDTLTLVPGTEVRVGDTDRTLELILNTRSPHLATAERRAEVLELIDVPLTARLASGRSSVLSVAEVGEYDVEKQDEMAELTMTEPLRFAVDPADDQSVAAGRAVVDMLARAGVPAVTVTTDLASVLTTGLPEGDLDGVITWTRNSTDPLSLAERYGCELALSGWCDTDTESYLAQVVAGGVEFDPSWGIVLNRQQALTLPILHETRVEARSTGIVGPTGDVNEWPGGIASAANWRKNDTEQ